MTKLDRTEELWEETDTFDGMMQEFGVLNHFDGIDLYVVYPDEGEQWLALGSFESFAGNRENPPEWDEKELGLFDTKLDAQIAAERWAVEIEEAAAAADREIDRVMGAEPEGYERQLMAWGGNL